MQISSVIPQLRTTDLAGSIAFYTEKLGFALAFRYEDFYAAVENGRYMLHLKLVDAADPSVSYVSAEEHFHLYFQVPDIDAAAEELRRRGVQFVRDVHDTAWGTRELVLTDNAGHTLYFGQRVAQPSSAEQPRLDAVLNER